MAQFNPKEFIYHHRNGKPAYYSYDEELYCGTFPEKWAKNHLPGTGPKDCRNCAHFGSWNGVFLGYCANCAEYEYNGERGRGLIDVGTEHHNDFVSKFPSIFETYLSGFIPDDVGDKDFMDSAAVYNYIDFQAPPPDDDENPSFYDKYFGIHIDDINKYYDEMCRRENEREQEEDEVSYTIDRYGSYYGSSYDGGYDSY